MNCYYIMKYYISIDIPSGNNKKLIKKKQSILKKKIKKKPVNNTIEVEKERNININNEEDELKKISKEIGGNVAGIMKQVRKKIIE